MSPPKSHTHDIEELFRDSEQDLKSFVSRRLGRKDAGEVEDIVQESFLRVSTQKSSEPMHNPRGFLFRTARNLIIDLARKRNVRAINAEAVQSTPQAERERTDQISPERAVSSQQELDLILNAIDELPPACQRVFLMQRQNDFSYAEVARRLNISESMVQKHMSKALCHLYKVLP